MRYPKRFLAALTAAMLLLPVSFRAEPGMEEYPEERWEWEAAEEEEAYWALSMWMADSEGTVNLYDGENNPLELEEEMRFGSGTFLETEEESLAVVDMDRERLAIMDETSRAGFEATDQGDRISIALQNGAMYFRVGQPLKEEESFDVSMGDIRLAVRGTCGMVQKNGESLSFILASGQAVITKKPESGNGSEEEAEEIIIEAGEIVSVTEEETAGGVRFESRKLEEDEVPGFLLEAFRRDTKQLEKVYAETGWEPEKLFGEDVPIWMPPARELDGVPEEWIGKIFGCGSWFEIQNYISFPSGKEILMGWEDDISKVYPLTSIREYTPHFYELCYARGASRDFHLGFLLPGITEDEIRQLKKARRVADAAWELLQGSNQYVVMHLEDDPALNRGFCSASFLEDVTSAGVKGAKPFADFRPSGFNHMSEGIFPSHGMSSELPDSLVGQKIIIDPVWESSIEFISKKAFTYTWQPDITMTFTIGDVEKVTDHCYAIYGFTENSGEQNHMLILPGLSDREEQFLREYVLRCKTDYQSYLDFPKTDGGQIYLWY